MTLIDTLRVKIFADGANLAEMLALSERPFIRGFTTNPTLLRKAGVTDYRRFAADVILRIGGRPISFEVFADDFATMECQAREIATWGTNVFVKIPITNARGACSDALVHRLSKDGVHINVTAVMTLEQVTRAAAALQGGAASNISVFAGRIADTGRDPIPIVTEAARIAASAGSELIWASPREVLNVVQADGSGCHIITLTGDLVRKLDLLGMDLNAMSLATVQMFHDDAKKAGLTLEGIA
jgi:transaldolase